MANTSLKNKIKANAQFNQRLYIALGITHGIYLLFQVFFQIMRYVYSSLEPTFFSFWPIMGYVFMLAITIGFVGSIKSARETAQNAGQASYSYTMDMLILTQVILLLELVTDWAWYLFFVVPIFGVYKAIRMLLNYVFTPDPEPEPMDEKRAKKKERKMERVKYARGGR